MINPALIRNCLEDELTQRGHFLVEVLVMPGNKIVVYIDSMKGVTLEECIAVSRFLESKLDRNVEDFELEVSSPGLDKPLKLPVQFEKNIGRLLDVLKYDGIKITGKLSGINQGMILLETEVIIKDSKSGKKKKEQKMQEIKYEDIKTAKVIISLKK
jgi:ribosome maturation factor RimP